MSSTIAEDRRQADGRRSIRERHVDHLGVAHVVDYIAEVNANVSAMMSARASQLESRLADSEMTANLNAIESTGSGTLLTNHSTATQNLAQIRQRFRDATGLAACRIAKWMLTLTDNQLRTIFGINGMQVIALRSRLTDMANAGDAAVAKVGE